MANRDNHTSPLRVLIVDDEFSIRDALSRWLRASGFEAVETATGAKGMKALESSAFDIALLDIRLPDIDGVQLLRTIKGLYPELIVIMMTAYATVDSAVQALRDGAFHYLTKPIDPDYLCHLIRQLDEQRKLRIENASLKEQLDLHLAAQDVSGHILGESAAIRAALALVQAVAPTDTTVLIRGESGTGKELLARMIHQLSVRTSQPLVAINCGGLTIGLAESELFGHEKGAFTSSSYRRKGKLELAHRGTLFLDEIGCIDQKTQTDLLRVLETRQFCRVGSDTPITVDFRLICATNHDLEAAVRDGSFREDLFYRLAVFPITVPALRERPGDIPFLASSLLAQIASGLHKQLTGFTPDALAVLASQHWPGNVRELRNCIERAAVLATGPEIGADLLGLQHQAAGAPEGESLDAVEQCHIQAILQKTNGNISHAASVLGIDRSTLYHKMERYGIHRASARQTH